MAAKSARTTADVEVKAAQSAARDASRTGSGKAAPSGVTLRGLIKFFSSLWLTVVCLSLGMVLIFIGTLAQVDLGLYKAQNEFFRSFFIYWGPQSAGWKIPVFPGGYLLGGVLFINLVTAHFSRFKLTKKKIGIWMVHVGIMLLLLGQFLTDLLSRESSMHLRNGQASNYSIAEREAELAVIDVTDADTDKVVAIPQGVLRHQGSITHAEMPFTVNVKKFFQNSMLEKLAPDAGPGPATQGVGSRVNVRELPHVTEMDKRDVPSAVVEIAGPQGAIGSWLVSEYVENAQHFKFNDRTYELVLRPRRFYEPYTLQLLKFQHDTYAGTDIPKNFSSRVMLQHPATGEKRETLIYMNSPLRYGGLTYYQAGFDPDDGGTILQVVRNPGWLTPYLACILVGAGLLVQFVTHLIGFVMKGRPA